MDAFSTGPNSSRIIVIGTTRLNEPDIEDTSFLRSLAVTLEKRYEGTMDHGGIAET